MMKFLQKQKGIIISCPEAIAYNNDWISKEELLKAAELMKKNDYGKYLSELAGKKNEFFQNKTKKLVLNNGGNTWK